jgi:signal transduction histidine kinase
VALVTAILGLAVVLTMAMRRSLRQRRALAATNESLERATRELATASRHKSEFLANMSHELRTPLNAIIGFSDVLEQRMAGELNAKQSEYARDISTSGRHLLDLVNEILDLSKVEAGRMELERGELALAETIREALAFVRERAARHGIELAAEIPSDLGTLVADQRKVRQIVLNLLSNAVKFTPDGGRIGVTARRQDGEVQVSVRDTGIGIAPEDHAKVFEEFQQVGRPSERSREGTGLGLTLAKRFVELHGGRIWFESEPGKCTTFTFALPAPTLAEAEGGALAPR